MGSGNAHVIISESLISESLSCQSKEISSRLSMRTPACASDVTILGDFVPGTAILLGVRFYVCHSRVISASAFSCALNEASPNSTMITCCRLVNFLLYSQLIRNFMRTAYYKRQPLISPLLYTNVN